MREHRSVNQHRSVDRHGGRKGCGGLGRVGRAARSAGVWCGLGPCVVQVGCDVEGLGQIGTAALDPAKSIYELPASQVMEGQYRSVRVAGVDNDSVYVLAITAGEDSHLLITDYRAGTTCDAGPAYEFARLTSGQYPLVLEVSTTPDDLGYRDIRFVDGHCQEVMPAIPETLEFYGWWQEDGNTQYDYWQKDGTFIVLNPYARERLLSVHALRYYSGSQIVTVEEQGLTLRDRTALDSPVSVVAGVSNFGTWSGGYTHQVTEGVRVIRGFTWDVGDDELVADACLVFPDADPSSSAVSSLLEVPCGSGERKLISPSRPSSPTSDTSKWFALMDVPAGLPPVREVSFRQAAASLFVEARDFHGVQLYDEYELDGGEPDVWPPKEPHEWTRVAEDLPARSRGLTNFGEDGGKLHEYGVDGWQVVAEHALGQLFGRYCDAQGGFLLLSRPPGTTGRLGCRSGRAIDWFANGLGYEGSYQSGTDLGDTLERGYFPDLSNTAREDWQDWGNLALVTDVESGSGKLRLYPVERGVITDRSPPVLVSGVKPWSAQASFSPRGAVYLKANSDTLAAFPVELGQEQIIDHGVSWFSVTDYPIEGVVYIVESGDDAGVWFARGR